jgi:hypothetical protein
VAELVRRTAAGRVLARDDVGGIAEALAALYREWLRTGTTAFEGREDEVKRLSRRERTRDLAALFDEVLEEVHGA